MRNQKETRKEKREVSYNQNLAPIYESELCPDVSRGLTPEVVNLSTPTDIEPGLVPRPSSD
jgi:hypothetical protein